MSRVPHAIAGIDIRYMDAFRSLRLWLAYVHPPERFRGNPMVHISEYLLVVHAPLLPGRLGLCHCDPGDAEIKAVER
jgi:hypothetical protein